MPMPIRIVGPTRSTCLCPLSIICSLPDGLFPVIGPAEDDVESQGDDGRRADEADQARGRRDDEQADQARDARRVNRPPHPPIFCGHQIDDGECQADADHKQSGEEIFAQPRLQRGQEGETAKDAHRNDRPPFGSSRADVNAEEGHGQASQKDGRAERVAQAWEELVEADQRGDAERRHSRD